MRIAAIFLTHNDCARAADLVAYIERVRAAFSGAEFFAVLTDAGSTDGTAEAVEALRKDRNWLHVLPGKDRNFGAAFSAGAKLAMQSLGVDFVLDADPGFRFQVEDAGALLASIGTNDLVIGSRFAGTAGSQPVCMFTQAGNFFARHILQCHGKKDASGGLRVMRAKGMLEHFDFASIESSACVYKFHLVSFLARSGAKIAEVPMRFEAREPGACQSCFFFCRTGDLSFTLA